MHDPRTCWAVRAEAAGFGLRGAFFMLPSSVGWLYDDGSRLVPPPLTCARSFDPRTTGRRMDDPDAVLWRLVDVPVGGVHPERELRLHRPSSNLSICSPKPLTAASFSSASISGS